MLIKVIKPISLVIAGAVIARGDIAEIETSKLVTTLIESGDIAEIETSKLVEPIKQDKKAK